MRLCVVSYDIAKTKTRNQLFKVFFEAERLMEFDHKMENLGGRYFWYSDDFLFLGNWGEFLIMQGLTVWNWK